MIELPAPLTIEGDVDAEDELIVYGEVRGTIWAESRAVDVAATGLVNGRIIAAEVTVKGSVSGSILAERSVEIFPGGMIDGRVVSPQLIVQDGAIHRGTFQPHRVDMALKVARHRRDQGIAAEPDPANSVISGPPTAQP